MAFWLWALLVAAVLIALIAVSRIRVRVRYARSGEQDELHVIAQALYGLLRYRVHVPAILLKGRHILYAQKAAGEIAGKPAGRQERWKQGKSWLLKSLKPGTPLRKMLKQMECTRFRLDMRVGTGDAPTTAMLSGLLWTLYGCALGFAGQVVSLKTKPYGAVQPVYQGCEFSLVWEADFRIRLGSFLAAGFRIWRDGIRHGLSFRNWRQRLAGPEAA